MAHYACLVQSGQEPDRIRATLEEGLKQLGQATFGDDPAEVEVQWTAIPRGFAWTAGEPSTSSIVVRSVPVGFDNTEREKFLRDVCDLWVRETKCSIEEIVATAFDGPLPL